MPQVAWITDCHFDHVDDEKKIIQFAQNIIRKDPVAVLVTGDTSNSENLIYHLSALESIVQRPVLFVLGNHDYYGNDIQSVRNCVKSLDGIAHQLKYLSNLQYVPISNTTAVVGHDCWYDCLYADPHRSNFVMSDWFYIKDFLQFSGGQSYYATERTIKDKNGLVSFARKLANEGIMHISEGIKAAVRHYKNIIVLSHPVPFKEAHIYDRAIGNDNAQPWYTSKQLGDTLLAAARAYPNVKFTSLSGHTHGEYVGKHAGNLLVRVGGARYGSPDIAGYIDV